MAGAAMPCGRTTDPPIEVMPPADSAEVGTASIPDDDVANPPGGDVAEPTSDIVTTGGSELFLINDRDIATIFSGGTTTAACDAEGSSAWLAVWGLSSKGPGDVAMAVDDKALLFAGSTGQLIVLLRPAGGLAEIGLFGRRPEPEGCSATRPLAGLADRGLFGRRPFGCSDEACGRPTAGLADKGLIGRTAGGLLIGGA